MNSYEILNSFNKDMKELVEHFNKMYESYGQFNIMWAICNMNKVKEIFDYMPLVEMSPEVKKVIDEYADSFELKSYDNPIEEMNSSELMYLLGRIDGRFKELSK